MCPLPFPPPKKTPFIEKLEQGWKRTRSVWEGGLRGGREGGEGAQGDINPRRRLLFTQSLPRARSPFTQQPPSVKLPALPPLCPPHLLSLTPPFFLWEIHSAQRQRHECEDVLAVATQSISFTCVGSTHPQDSAYRAFMFPFPLGSVSGFSVRLSHLSCLIGALHGLKGRISNSVMLKRDPWASLYMNNPCVFIVVGDKKTEAVFECLLLNVCQWWNKRMFTQMATWSRKGLTEIHYMKTAAVLSFFYYI